MLNSTEKSAAMIVQIASDWQSSRSLVLIPVSNTEASERELDLLELDVYGLDLLTFL